MTEENNGFGQAEPAVELTDEELAALKPGMSAREKVLAAVAGVAVVAAIAGFALFAINNVPAGTAAKYSGGTISEASVAASIEQYRKAYSLTDDSTFASQLKSQSMTVASYRQNTIDQLIIAQLVEKRAEELGVSASDEEVEAELGDVSGQISSGDDSLWQSTLDSMGITEDDLKTRYRANILQDKECEQDVPKTDATDEEVLSYIQSNLASSTQMQVYSIVFSSDDGKSSTANTCYEELKALKDSGKLTLKAFKAAAAKYSEAENAQETEGELGWTGSGNIGTDVSELIQDMKKGEMSELTTISEDDDALEIVYVADTFEFPEASEITSVDSLNVPDALLSIIKSAATDEAWQSSCSSYLAKLLADAKVTYYPVPDDASYNVSLG